MSNKDQMINRILDVFMGKKLKKFRNKIKLKKSAKYLGNLGALDDDSLK